MPKILRIINRFNLGGITYNVSYLSKYISAEYETKLIGGPNEPDEENSEFIARDLGLDPIVIPEMKRSIHPLHDLAAYRHIKKIIQEFKPDIVHTHAAKAGALGRRAAYDCKVPVIVHTFHGHVFHSYFGKARTSFYKGIERRLAKKTSAIIAISEKQKEELVQIHKICPAEKVTVIPLGFDLDRFHEHKEEKRIAFRKKYRLEDDVIAIGIVGRLVPVKNHALFLQAIRYVIENTSKKIAAFIVGDGEERASLERMVTELGLGDHVIFTSWEKQTDRVYPGLDIVCLTSFNEGTPVSLIEAQAAGVPIVSTNVGGIENVVVPGTTALLSENGDGRGFFRNLLILVNDTQTREQMKKEGWPQVRDRFHYTRLVKDMANLYNVLLGGKNA